MEKKDINDLLALIAKGKVKEALDWLIKSLTRSNSEDLNIAILLSDRYHQLKINFQMGVLSSEEYLREHSQITHRSLSLIQQIESNFLSMALERITTCMHTQKAFLDLSNCGMTELPKEITKLTWLKKLSISNHSMSNQNDFKNDVSSLFLLVELKELKELEIIGVGLKNLSFLESLKNLRTLTLEHNEIENEAFSSLAPLKNLEFLKITHEYIYDISFVKSLKRLNELELVDNVIVDPEPIGDLTQLKILIIKSTRIKKFDFIKKLTHLTVLMIVDGHLSDIIWIQDLHQLKILNLEANQIENIAPLEKLANLIKLNLSDNKIMDIKPIIHLSKIESLKITGNDIKDLPKEIISANNINQIRTYYKSIQSENEKDYVSSNEVKLILVGNSTVGKTTLSKLLRKQPIQKNENSTHGIQTSVWKPSVNDYPMLTESPELTVNIWDFGGQEYYHATHHVFFNENAVYILLWDSQTNLNATIETPLFIHGIQQSEKMEHFDRKYWLDSIRHYAPKSSILLVQNKIDIDSEQPIYSIRHDAYNDMSANEAPKTEYVNYRLSFWNVDKSPQNRSFQGRFELFCDDLMEQLLKSAARNVFHPNWSTIMNHVKALNMIPEKLSQKRQQTAPLSFNEFSDLCRNIIKKKLDEDSIRTLITCLHETGALLYYPKVAALTDKIFLRPAHMIQEIYTQITKPAQLKGGLLDMQGIDAACIELMKLFRIVFTHPILPNQYLMPLYLPENDPIQLVIDMLQLSNVFFIWLPAFHHRDLIFKLIHADPAEIEHKYFWKNGLLVAPQKDKKVSILIQALKEEKSPYGWISIHLGTPQDLKQYAKWCLEQFAAASKLSENSMYISLNKMDLIRISDLETAAKNGNQVIKAMNSDNFLQITKFEAYLDKRIKLKKPIRVFISYAHEDMVSMESFRKHTRFYQNQGIIELVTDKEILLGQTWEDRILTELEIADMILLWVSADFMRSDYIQRKEVPVALKRSKRDKIPVIPVAVRPLSWTGLPFSHLQGCPKDKEGDLKALSSWQNEDEAIKMLVEQLTQIIQKM